MITMNEYKPGDVIQVIVVGSQPYGLFVKAVEDDEVTGLIHISELSYGFVKDVNQIAKMNETLTAKVLEFDKEAKHLKLSIKACQERSRFQNVSNLKKMAKEKNEYLKDFSRLSESLGTWIAKELEKEEV